MSWLRFLLFIFLTSVNVAQFANSDVEDVYDELASFLLQNDVLPNEIRFNDDIFVRPISFTNYQQEKTITFLCEVEADERGSVPSWVSVSQNNGMFGVFIIETKQYMIKQRPDGSHYLVEDQTPTSTLSQSASPLATTVTNSDIAANSIPIKISFEYTSAIWKGLLSKAQILAYARFQLDGIRYVFGPVGYDFQLADIILRPDRMLPDGVRTGESNRMLIEFRVEQNKPANSNIHVYMDRDLNGGMANVNAAYHGIDAYFIALTGGKFVHGNRNGITHELGHLLGEGHTECGSVMNGCEGVTSFFGVNADQTRRYQQKLRDPTNLHGLSVIQDPTWKVRRVLNKKTCAVFDGNQRNCNRQVDCMERARVTCSSGFYAMHLTNNFYRCCESGEMQTDDGWHVFQVFELDTPYADLQSFNAHPEFRIMDDVAPERVTWEVLNDRAICHGPGNTDENQKRNAGAWYPDKMTEGTCAQTIALNPDSCPSGIMEYIGGSHPLARRCRCCEPNYTVGPAFVRHQISRVSIVPNCGTWGTRRIGRTGVGHQKRYREVAGYEQCQTHCENFARCQAIRWDATRGFCDILARRIADDEIFDDDQRDTSVADFIRSTSECDSDDGAVTNEDCTTSSIDPARQCTSACELLQEEVVFPATGSGRCSPQTHQCVSGEGECGLVSNQDCTTRSIDPARQCTSACELLQEEVVTPATGSGQCSPQTHQCVPGEGQCGPSSATSGWEVISANKACERNDEGISRTFGQRGFTLESCQARCESTSGCVAIDFYSVSGWCNLFNEACTNPLRERAGSSSYRRLVEDQIQWEVIHANKACENNREGIQRTFGHRGFTLETCQRRCEQTDGCSAIDFYSRSGWCNLFDEACTNPITERGGSSSYRIAQVRRHRLLALETNQHKF